MRAVHTAEIINRKNRIIVPVQQLTERNLMALNGKPLQFTDREEYWNYYFTVDYGAEPIKIFFEQVYKFLDSLKTRPFRNVLIVAHSGVSKTFYGYFNGIPSDGKFLNLGLKNCEVKKYWLEGVHKILHGNYAEEQEEDLKWVQKCEIVDRIAECKKDAVNAEAYGMSVF